MLNAILRFIAPLVITAIIYLTVALLKWCIAN